MLGGDADALVFDAKPNVIAADFFPRNVNFTVWLGVFDGIVDQVKTNAV